MSRYVRGVALLGAALLPLMGVTAAHAVSTPHLSPTSALPPLEQRGENLDDYSSNPAYAMFYTQQVEWSAATCPKASTSMATLRALPRDPGQPTVTGVLCAKVKAPKDWHDASKGTIDVGVSKIVFSDSPATPARLMFSNPGGPGIGMLTMLPAGVAQLTGSTSSHLNVGVDARGLGLSTNVTCPVLSPEPQDTAHDARGLRPELVRAQIVHRNERLHACLQQPGSLLPTINTEQTVRDYNLVRHVLGYATADLTGISYGSWFGSVAGKMFPRSFDRIVLDANMDHAGGSFLRMFNYQPESRQAGMDRTWLPWMARHDATYHLGATPTDVNANLEELRLALSRGKFAPRWHADTLDFAIVTSLDAAQFFPPNAEAISALYASFRHGTPVPAAAAATLDQASHPEDLGQGVVYNDVVQYGISCNDTGSFGTVDRAVETVLTARTQYPLSGAFHGATMCAQWPQPAALTPEVLDRPLYALMTQTENDGRTSYTGAHHSRFATRGHVRMVAIDDQIGHGALAHPCATAVINAYLHDGAFPADDVRCQAGPLPGDTKVYEFMNASSYAQPLPAPFTYTTRDLSLPAVDEEASAQPRRAPSARDRGLQELLARISVPFGR